MQEIPCKTKPPNSLRIRLKEFVPYTNIFFGLILLLISAGNAIAHPDSSYYKQGEIRFQNHCYSPNIKSVNCHLSGNPLSYPVVNINFDQKLMFTFDDLDADIKNYGYKIIHCTFDWKPSQLGEYEYLEGYYQNSIRDYEGSFNTFVPYTNYYLEIPNNDVNITKSGNYLLMVYLEEEPETPVITRRFCVYENASQLKIDAHAPTRTIDREYKQEIDFSVMTGGLDIVDPYSRMHVSIIQNGRWDNAAMDMVPKFIKDKEVIFDDNKKNVFNGIAEYRRLNIQSEDYQTEEIQQIEMDSGVYNVYMLPEEKRTYSQYLSRDDLDGQYLIKLQNSDRSYVEADYFYVHFRLKWPEPISNGSVYIIGDLADGKINEDFKMKYDHERKEYTCRVLLKQGYYNYMYGLVRDNSNEADVAFFEGTHFETENVYQVMVYYRDFTGYDRLIGYETVNTLTDGNR